MVPDIGPGVLFCGEAFRVVPENDVFDRSPFLAGRALGASGGCLRLEHDGMEVSGGLVPGYGGVAHIFLSSSMSIIWAASSPSFVILSS